MSRGIRASVIVAALGYFVDVYDLILFTVVRVASLKDLGVTAENLLPEGVFLLNVQMAGLLLGGILWGVWGDIRGRIAVLFGSIALYSLSNIANAFVGSVEAYAVCRFLAGIGLAGELGAGITLVNEIMDRETRGYGTTIVATVGVAGAVVAAIVGDFFSWRTAYVVGGCMGLALLLMRVAVYESGLFEKMSSESVSKGNLLMLFRPRERLIRYLSCILVGVPIWFVVGILVTFSPEIARAMSVQGEVTAGRAVLFTYIGFVLGDLASGLLSQYLRSRKKAIGVFLFITTIAVTIFLSSQGRAAQSVYYLTILLGFGGGYWAVFVTSASEQFGTNLRATVTTTAPNFVRGFTVLLTVVFQHLTPTIGIISSATCVGLGTLLLAVGALFTLNEPFGKDLNFLEE